jgi:hypothetical protein
LAGKWPDFIIPRYGGGRRSGADFGGVGVVIASEEVLVHRREAATCVAFAGTKFQP